MERFKVLVKHITPGSSNHSDPASSYGTSYPIFVGGITMDIFATPDARHKLHRGGSVPGAIRQIPGGVCHNVAESLYKLMQSCSVTKTHPLPLLVTCVGSDTTGSTLTQHWGSFGMSTECIFKCDKEATATISIIFDEQGDVAASIADVAAVEKSLTPALLRSVEDKIGQASIAMIDGDMSAESVETACRIAGSHNVPIWFEPVSAPKGPKATNVLSLLDYISPNQQELVSMATAYRQQKSGHTHRSKPRKLQSADNSSITGIREVLSLHHDIATLIEAGVKNIVLTLGSNGAVLCRLGKTCQHIDAYYLPALPCRIMNCSGAGDCLVAGFVFALLNNEDPDYALAYGAAAAKCAVQTNRNVPERFDIGSFKQDVTLAADNLRHFQLPFLPLM